MWHSLMQIFLLMTFAIVSASVEWRRTGLILSGFALLYLGLNVAGAHELMNSLSPPLYALLYAGMDLAAARLLILYGDKGSRPQAAILCAFVCAHIMAWLYATGLPGPLDPHRYVVLTMSLAVLQIMFAIPGIRDAFYEVRYMVEEALAGRRIQRRMATIHSRPHDTDSLSGSAGISDASGGGGRADIRGIQQIRGPGGEVL